MGLDTNHLKLTVKQHIERSFFILRDPKQFFSTLFTGEIPLKEQVIPFFVLFSLLNITLHTIIALFTYETVSFALQFSLLIAIQQGLLIALLSFVLPRIEQYTNLSATPEKYATLLVYSSTASYYSLIASNIISILGICSLYSLYLIYIGLQSLVSTGKTLTMKSYGILLAAGIICCMAINIVTSPLYPSWSSMIKYAAGSDDELLLQKLKEIHDLELKRFSK